LINKNEIKIKKQNYHSDNDELLTLTCFQKQQLVDKQNEKQKWEKKKTKTKTKKKKNKTKQKTSK